MRRLLPLLPVTLLVVGCSSGGGALPSVGSSGARASGAGTTTASPGVGPGGAVANAHALQDAFVAVVARVRPSVVQIETADGLGSGIIFDTKGDIVTNAHVVGTSTTFQVTLSDGKKRSAALVGTAPDTDLAVVRTDGTGLTAATFADSSKLQVGDIVMAVGNPLGLSSSVTEGIVSAVGRSVSEGNGVTLADTIQTSASINPGNSGGALVDLDGAVVGIPTLAATDQQLGGQAPGIGFAIPGNTVRQVAGQLIQGGGKRPQRGYIGIRAATLPSGGILVSRVDAGGPADRAGIVGGDVIVGIDGRATTSVDDLNSLLGQHAAGDVVSVAVLHDDGTQGVIKVTLGAPPGL